MTEDSDSKTQRFIDALDDTVPKLRIPADGDFPIPETSSNEEAREERQPSPALARFLHLMAALLVLSVVPSQIIGPVLGHLNGSAPITNVQLVGVAVKMGLFAVFLWSWLQFARMNKD